MVPMNIIKLTKHIFPKYLGIKFPSLLYQKKKNSHLYFPRNVIPRNKFDKLETNTPVQSPQNTYT